MSRLSGLNRLARVLTRKHQPPMSLREICAELECSEKTADRYLRELRDTHNYPIEYDRDAGGYRIVPRQDGEAVWELPGLFFSQSELTALVTMQHLLATVRPGLFVRDLVPFGRRIESLLEKMGVAPAEVARRIRVLAIGARPAPEKVFRAATDAVLSRRRLDLEYKPRGRDGDWERRIVSPQRLVRYRDNWYLDGWCHARNGVRVFALDQMREVRILDDAAIDVPENDLDELVRSSYGIFTGRATSRAVLRFSPRRAQWVAKEEWHPDQVARALADGSFELEIPYGRAEELVMDILRHGPDVEVVEPAELRAMVADLHARAAAVNGATG